MSAGFDAHEFIQWCASHPEEKAPKHTVGDLLTSAKHSLTCAECREACQKASEKAGPTPMFGPN